MVGRILVEMFRAAVNNQITLVIELVMQQVQLIIDDNGKCHPLLLITAFEIHISTLRLYRVSSSAAAT